MRARPALQSLLDAALAFLHPRLAVGAQLLGLRLLLGCENREQLAAEPCPLHRQVGFDGGEILHHRANASLVNRQRVDRLLLCGTRHPEPLHQRPRLLPMLLRDVLRLLALRLCKIQGREREPRARTAGTTWSTPAWTGRTLSKSRRTRNKKHERGKDDVSD